MARGLPFTYGPSRTAPKSSTARAMGVLLLASCVEKKLSNDLDINEIQWV